MSPAPAGAAVTSPFALALQVLRYCRADLGLDGNVTLVWADLDRKSWGEVCLIKPREVRLSRRLLRESPQAIVETTAHEAWHVQDLLGHWVHQSMPDEAERRAEDYGRRVAANWRF